MLKMDTNIALIVYHWTQILQALVRMTERFVSEQWADVVNSGQINSSLVSRYICNFDRGSDLW